MKNILKRFISIGILITIFSVALFAQKIDSRNRTIETIVADGLMLLPASDSAAYNKIFYELSSTGEKGVELIANMLLPADQGKNAKFEYALNGIASYVSNPKYKSMRDAVRKGFLTAIKNCDNNVNRAFLISQLQLISTKEDAKIISSYLNDKEMMNPALNMIISTSGTEELLLDLGKKPNLSNDLIRALSYAYGMKNMSSAEHIMLGWLNGADKETAEQIYSSLGICGTEASLKTLMNAAKTSQYDWAQSGVTDSYLRVLDRLSTSGNKVAIKNAKKLLKNDNQYIRGGAIEILSNGLNSKKMVPIIINALKDSNKEYRYAALQSLDNNSELIISKLLAKSNKFTPQAKAEIIRWLGANGIKSNEDFIVNEISSQDNEVASAAIKAAGLLGGKKSLNALIGALGGNHSKEAVNALMYINEDVKPEIEKIIKNNEENTILPALKLAANKRMTSVGDNVIALLNSNNKEVSNEAYKALSSVSGEKNIDKLSDLLNKTDESHIYYLQSALNNAVNKLPYKERYSAIEELISKSDKPERYYKILANNGSNAAIDNLVNRFNKNKEEKAMDALLSIDNPNITDVLYDFACNNELYKDRALNRYALLLDKKNIDEVARLREINKALELQPKENVVTMMLNSLSKMKSFPALVVAAKYLDNDGTKRAAAGAIKSIISKSEPVIGGKFAKEVLTKAHSIYKDLAKTDADAGYAVDEISGILSNMSENGFDVFPIENLNDWRAVSINELFPLEKDKKIKKVKPTINGWSINDGILSYNGNVVSAIGTQTNYENFEMWLEWRGEKASSLIVRSLPEVVLGNVSDCDCKIMQSLVQTAKADNCDGWNTLYIKVLNDRITVIENNKTIAKDRVMINTLSETLPVNESGFIGFVSNSNIDIKNICINELPTTPVFKLPAEEAKKGYEVLFDGRSMHKWCGNTTNYVPIDGSIYVTANYGGSGNLYTKKQYSDFNLRFEFCFMREGVNNGVGIRTPMGVDAAYHGMEIQVLDHDAPIYKNLRKYQQHGSVYGIIPAKRVKFGEVGTWHTMEINAVGYNITVIVDGEVIVDGNIYEACQGNNVTKDGSSNNPYTVDHNNHPGLFNKEGHIGFLGHGEGLKYRNVRILDLKKK